MISTVRVTCLFRNEDSIRLPQALAEHNSYLLPNLDTKWVWVAIHEGEVKACLIAAPFHGIVFLAVLNAVEGTPGFVVRALLKEALAHIQERGYSSFSTYLDAARVKELKLARIIQRYGGVLLPASGFWAVAPIR